jgi:copper transport protein
VKVGPLPKGVYTVAWRAVSRVDGHLASGTFAFGVQESPTSATTGGSAQPGPANTGVAARWALYVGLMLVVGGAVASVVCFAQLPPHTLGILGLGVALAIGGAIGLALDAGRVARLSTSDLLRSSLGHQLEHRLVPIALAGILVVAAAVVGGRRPAIRRGLLLATAAAGALGMLADVDGSHAAAAHSWRWARIGFQWAHFLGVGVWIAGLAIVVVHIRAQPPAERVRTARRFSAVALVAVAVVAASGAQRAYDEVGTLQRLTSTAFGHVVLIKSSLLIVLVALGAFNRYRSVPAVARRERGLRVVGRSELAVAGIVLVAAGVLQGLAPPSSFAPAPNVKPIVLSGNDFGTTVRLRLTIKPGTAGFNAFVLRVTDYDTGAPVAAIVATLTFTLPSRPDLGASTLTLKPSGAGTYVADEANLSIDGIWSVTALIQRASGGVEVAFTVPTRVLPQKVTVAHNRGLPDVYTVQLSGSRSAQIYLDPGRVGVLNEFHVTMIGADGNELPISSLAVTASRQGGTSTPLTVRRLDPIGHFVADLEGAISGRYQFMVNATTTEGETLRLHLTLPVA